MSTIYQSDDWRALLRGICEVPDADLPRLVAADWLDEHDESEYAECIRLGVAQPDKCHGYNSHRGVPWSKPFGGVSPVVFRSYRGFTKEIELPYQSFEENIDMIFMDQPITSVVLSDKRPWLHPNSIWGWRGIWVHEDHVTSSTVNHPESWLSHDLYTRLVSTTQYPGSGLCGYLTWAEANKALSDACVALGRERAKLQPLQLAPS